MTAGLGAGLGLMPLSTGEKEAKEPKKHKPNLLLILTDDQQYWTLNERFMPKTMSWLVHKGLRLLGYVNDPLCTPSRADILTGKYTHNHRVAVGRGGGEDYLRTRGLDEDTIATRIKAAGYRTAYIGKYMNKYEGSYVPPGWDRWFAMVGDYNRESSYRVNADGELHTFDRNKDNETKQFWKKAESFVRDNKGEPWFCYVGVHAPHGPYYPLNPHAFDDIELYNVPSRGEEEIRDKPSYARKKRLPSDEDRERWRKQYEGKAEELQEIDELVDRVLTALAETKQLANTYIFFATDNGYLMGEHRLNSKGVPYEEATRTPFVVRGPDVPRGARSRALVGLIDLPPTLCELAGASISGFDGRPLSPALDGTVPDTWRKYLFVEHVPSHTFRMLRTERYVYVEYPGTGERELYDMFEDPNQLRSLHRSGSTEVKALISEFSGRLARFKDCSGDACRSAEV